MSDLAIKQIEVFRQVQVNLMDSLLELARFSATCCDKPDDRFYHAEDETWWKRIEISGHPMWVAADPPEGWSKK